MVADEQQSAEQGPQPDCYIFFRKERKNRMYMGGFPTQDA